MVDPARMLVGASAEKQSAIVQRSWRKQCEKLKYWQMKSYRIVCPPIGRTASDRVDPWSVGRQDRVEPSDECDAGVSCAGDLQELVRRFRPGQNQRGPDACQLSGSGHARPKGSRPFPLHLPRLRTRYQVPEGVRTFKNTPSLIAAAIAGHADIIATCRSVIYIDVRPGDNWWVEIVDENWRA